MHHWPVRVLGAIACLLVVSGCSNRSGDGATPATVVIIDPAVGETFTPAPFPGDAGLLSADQAWQRWEHGAHLPNSIPATYGTLTLLTGPEGEPGVETKEAGTPVWGYQEDVCVGPGAPESCTTWTFVDAKTGHMIDMHSVPKPS